jgi:DNA-binding transcriptional LysR family regulator
MNLKQLNQFVVLAETLNFRSAAMKLNMAQPPLSVSIRNLEEDIGQRLFQRSTKGVQLTSVGKSVLEHARRTIFHADQFRHAAQLAAGGQVGSLRINFVASSTLRLLPRAIIHFRASHPKVNLHLLEASTDSIMIGLRDGVLDVGLVRSPTPTYPSVMTVLIEQNHYIAALPKNHPMAFNARLRLIDLRDEPFILPSPKDGSAAYMSMMLACQQAGFTPHIVQEASHAQTILALVESGLGVALVPNPWKDLVPRDVVFISLEGMPTSEMGIAFACRKKEEHGALVQEFRKSVEAAASHVALCLSPNNEGLT